MGAERQERDVTPSSVNASNVVALWQRRDAMINPVITSLVRYWDGLRNGDDVPRRTDVDPRGFKDALPYSFILEQVKPGAVRFRLAGQHLTQLMGMDVRGMPLRSLFELSDRKRLMEHVDSVFQAPCSLDAELVSDAQGRMPLEGRMTLLPLKGTDGEVTKALGILVTDGMIGLPPRRFRIRKQSLHPVRPGSSKIKASGVQQSEMNDPPSEYHARTRASGPPILSILPGGKYDA